MAFKSSAIAVGFGGFISGGTVATVVAALADGAALVAALAEGATEADGIGAVPLSDGAADALGFAGTSG
jgi:hypothetical protein